MADIGKTRVKMISVPFNYRWPYGGKVSVVRELGPALLDDTIAEAAIKAGAAVPFDPAPAAKKAPARRRSTAPKKPANTAGDAADERQSDRMDREDLAAADSANGGAAMDDAG